MCLLTEAQKVGYVTYVIRIMTRGCSIEVAVGKDEPSTLPIMSGTHTNVVHSAVGDLPPCRHVQRLFAILNHRTIINSVHMQRLAEVAAVALENAGYRV